MNPAAVFDQVEKAVKSVNHHLKSGDQVPLHTKEAMGSLTAQLEQLSLKANFWNLDQGNPALEHDVL